MIKVDIRSSAVMLTNLEDINLEGIKENNLAYKVYFYEPDGMNLRVV